MLISFGHFLDLFFFYLEENGVSNRELIHYETVRLKSLFRQSLLQQNEMLLQQEENYTPFIQSRKIMPHNIKGFPLWNNKERAIPILLASQGIFIHMKCSTLRVWDLIKDYNPATSHVAYVTGSRNRHEKNSCAMFVQI